MTGRSYDQEANLRVDDYLVKGYFVSRQWVNYGEQVNAIRALNPTSILEIGIGNGIVCSSLRHFGYKVTTFDINKKLQPDFSANILEIDQVFPENSFDCILCAEVLEHLPLNDFEKCLEKLARVTSKNVVLTLPRTGCLAHFFIGLPLISFDFMLPFPFTMVPSEHHWEIDSEKATKMKNIQMIINKYFRILNYYRTPNERKIYFFILEKK